MDNRNNLKEKRINKTKWKATDRQDEGMKG